MTTKPKLKDKGLHVKTEGILLENLAALSQATGRKKSDLVREAVQEMYLTHLQNA